MSSQLIILIVVSVVVLIGLIGVVVWRCRCREKGVTVEDTTNLSKQLYIGNLDYQVREKELRQLFGDYGQIASIKVVRDMRTRRSKGFGFITYDLLVDAQQALKSDGQLLNGRALVVRMAKTR